MSRLLPLVALVVAAPLAAAQTLPITTDSELARAHYELGVEGLQNFSMRSQDHFDAALEEDPDFALARLMRAFAGGDDREEDLGRIARLMPDLSPGERMIVEAFQAAEDNDDLAETRETLGRVVERYPDDTAAIYLLARAQESGEAAVEVLDRALAVDPGFAAAYNLRGYEAMRVGDMAAAERAFREQVRRNPHLANAWDSLGEFHLEQGDEEEAERAFYRALAIEPDFTNALANLAKIGAARGDRDVTAAAEAQDADAMAALYTADAVMVPPGEAPVVGRDAIRAMFASFFADGDDGVEIETVDVFTSGDVAVATRLLTIRNGGRSSRSRNVAVWTQADGEWKIAREVWHEAPPE